MDIEFHYYITYILARKAGFARDEASIVAYASQYTDDNCYRYYVNFETGDDEYLTRVSQTMDITKPSVKQQRIYPFFHFFPGDPESPTAARKDKAVHAFNTTPDSENVQYVFRKALESGNPYRIGIAAHVYADSWAHQNFLGFGHRLNAMGSITPNIGHADAFHDPDKVDHTWTDHRLVEEYESIENNGRFLDGAEKIFTAFRKYKEPQWDEGAGAYEWSVLRGQLADAMSAGSSFIPILESDQKERIRKYTALCDDIPEYDKNEWRRAALEKRAFEEDLFDRYWAKEDFFDSRWYKFQEAVKEHIAVSRERLKALYG